MFDVVQKVDGNITVVSSWGDDKKVQAESAFYERVHLLLADKDTTNGVVKLLDDNLDVVDGCIKKIVKE